MFDVVVPKNKKDEDDFKALALVLGWNDVLFLSSDKKAYLVLAESKNIHLLKKSKIVFCKGSRDAIERGAHILFDFEANPREDFIHHRASGLNQVLCKLAKKHNSIIAFNFNSILEADDVMQAKIIGRMQQNIRLCRKYKVPMLPLTFAAVPYQMRSMLDFKAFFIDIGMHPKEITDGQKKFRELLDKFSKPL